MPRGAFFEKKGPIQPCMPNATLFFFQGGEETSTEYLAALLTTLETAETEENLSAILSLVSMVIKTVPREVLVSMFSKVNKLPQFQSIILF